MYVCVYIFSRTLGVLLQMNLKLMNSRVWFLISFAITNTIFVPFDKTLWYSAYNMTAFIRILMLHIFFHLFIFLVCIFIQYYYYCFLLSRRDDLRDTDSLKGSWLEQRVKDFEFKVIRRLSIALSWSTWSFPHSLSPFPWLKLWFKK